MSGAAAPQSTNEENDEMLRNQATIAGVSAAVGIFLYHAAGKIIRRNKKPTLYVYEHCPFSVRTRVILGLKHVDHHLVFMEGHDYDVPVSLVGAKQAPILQFPSGSAMAESMDIVRYVDQHWGGAPILAESANRPELIQWIEETFPVINKLVTPRYVSMQTRSDSPCATSVQYSSAY